MCTIFFQFFKLLPQRMVKKKSSHIIRQYSTTSHIIWFTGDKIVSKNSRTKLFTEVKLPQNLRRRFFTNKVFTPQFMYKIICSSFFAHVYVIDFFPIKIRKQSRQNKLFSSVTVLDNNFAENKEQWLMKTQQYLRKIEPLGKTPNVPTVLKKVSHVWSTHICV